MINFLECEICGGKLNFDMEATVNSYMDSEGFSVEDINKYAEQMVQEFMIFVCRDCGNVCKLTIRDIELAVRNAAIKKAVSMVCRDMIISNGIIPKRRVMVYCGKCNGFDGKGSCFIDAYNNCDLKRFPIDS